MSNNKNILYCSFCGKSQHEVRKLIAGPSVYVCDECVELCNDIIREELQESAQEAEAKKLPTPAEIKDILSQKIAREYIWCQEEPKNQGPWKYVKEMFEYYLAFEILNKSNGSSTKIGLGPIRRARLVPNRSSSTACKPPRSQPSRMRSPPGTSQKPRMN